MPHMRGARHWARRAREFSYYLGLLPPGRRLWRYLPRFFRDARSYRDAVRHGTSFPFAWSDVQPMLADFAAPAGSAGGQYFHQDLWAARRIHAARPRSHVDIGSRVDGFVAHVLTFMPVTVLDIRPLESDVRGLTFVQGDVCRLCAFASEQGAPEAYYQDGAMDGSRPGVFYVNLRDTSLIAKYSMRTLAYHEGIPGHHFQVSIAQELQGVPFFRKVIPFTAYIEGWALYAERLAFELGFERDPLDNLGRLRDEMMRAARLVVDTGIHAKRWTREQAVAYMIDKTGFDEASVVTEIERYFVDPGQALAYKIGMLKILALREKAKLSLGAKFDLAQFHNQVLTHGALPLVVLERVIDGWIATQQAGG